MREFAVSVLVRLQDRLSQPLGGLQRRLQGLGRLGERLGLGRVGAQLANVGKQFTILAGAAALAFTAIGGGAWSMARSVANAGDAAYKAAQRVGVNVETYQELAFAAKMSDLSVESLQKALGTLNEKAVAGDEMFAKLGIALKDSQGNLRDSGDLLKDLATLFSQLPEGAQKAALAAKIFGDRLGRELIPFLNEGRDGLDAIGQRARELGIVLPEELAKAAVDWNDSITVFGAVFEGIKMEVFGPLIPIFNELTNSFRAFIQENKTEIVEKMAATVKSFAEAIPDVAQGFLDAAAAIMPIVSAAGSFIDAIGGMETVVIVVASVISTKLLVAIGTLGVVLASTPVGLFVLALVAIAGLAKKIYDNWDGIAEWFGALWESVKQYTSDAFDFLKWAVGFHPLLLIANNWEPISEFMAELWEGVKSVVSAAFDGLLKLLSWHPLALIVANWEPILGFMSQLWESVNEGIKAKFGELIAWFKRVPGMIMEAIGKIDLSNIISWPSLPSWLGGGDAPAQVAPPSIQTPTLNPSAMSVPALQQQSYNLDPIASDPRLASAAAAAALGRSRDSGGASSEGLRAKPQEVDVGGQITIKVDGPGKVTSVENANRGVRIAPERGASLVNP